MSTDNENPPAGLSTDDAGQSSRPPTPSAGPPTSEDPTTNAAESGPNQIIIGEFTATQHAGPLPPPETLAAYDQLLPGAADRILVMAEEQLAHRHTFQHDRLRAAKEKMRWDAGSDLLGTVAALIVSLAITSVGAYAIAAGSPVVGGSIVTTTIVGLAAVFVYGRRTGAVKHHGPTAIAEPKGRGLDKGQ